jgi:hypothetical protein
MVQPSNAQIQAGWPESATPPARQYFNWLFYFITNAVRYYAQRGLTDYNAGETYQLNARVIGDDGNTYVSLQNANTGNTPSTSGSWWAQWGLTLAEIASSIAAGNFIKANSASQKVQFGTGTGPGAIVFAQAFSGTPVVVGTGYSGTFGATSVSSTGFTAAVAGGLAFGWIAIGPA